MATRWSDIEVMIAEADPRVFVVVVFLHPKSATDADHAVHDDPSDYLL